MIPLAQKTVELQGKTYELKPFSAINESRMIEQGSILSAELDAGKITKFQYYDKFLPLIIKGPHEWDVTSPEFDGREAENAILSFVPPSMQAYVLLTGFRLV